LQLRQQQFWHAAERNIKQSDAAGSRTPYIDNDGDANNSTIRNRRPVNARVLGLAPK